MIRNGPKAQLSVICLLPAFGRPTKAEEEVRLQGLPDLLHGAAPVDKGFPRYKASRLWLLEHWPDSGCPLWPLREEGTTTPKSVKFICNAK